MPIPHQDSTDLFLSYLLVEKRYSVHTVTAYKNDLLSFAEFLRLTYEINDLETAKSPQIRSWLAFMKAEKYTAKTLNRKISTLKSFYKYAERIGIISSSPMDAIISPRIAKKLPVYIDEKDIFKLLNEIEFADTLKGNTDKLILKLLYSAGIREAELISLKYTDIDYYAQSIRVLGKGNKVRIIPVTKNLLNEIKNYAEFKTSNGHMDGRKELLMLESGKRLYPKYVYKICSTYLGSVSTIAKKSPHVLRHSFATHLSNNGADINAVKELLGHSSLAATQVYLHNNINQLKDVFKKAHPKA